MHSSFVEYILLLADFYSMAHTNYMFVRCMCVVEHELSSFTPHSFTAWRGSIIDGARNILKALDTKISVRRQLHILSLCAAVYRYKVEGVVDADPQTVFSYIDPSPASPRAKWDKAIKELHIIEQLDKATIQYVTAFSVHRLSRSFCHQVQNDRMHVIFFIFELLSALHASSTRSAGLYFYSCSSEVSRFFCGVRT